MSETTAAQHGPKQARRGLSNRAGGFLKIVSTQKNNPSLSTNGCSMIETEAKALTLQYEAAQCKTSQACVIREARENDYLKDG